MRDLSLLTSKIYYFPNFSVINDDEDRIIDYWLLAIHRRHAGTGVAGSV